MPKEIKFRAWVKQEQKMYPVVGLVKDKVMICTGEVVTVISIDEVDLMQYIGFEDIKGKEIYQGDIVRYTDPAQHDLPATTMVVAVSWDEETAGFNLGYVDHRITVYDDVEVIGNICEHPDIVEVKRDKDQSK